ncbi:MAG TPA: hypothetical protein VFX57_03905 [Sulfuricurvum sp.]|nr:hypothetical protein [Sulfuricurvum sp.]
MKNNEPNLRDLEDYNTLKGEKKRIVWIVIIAGLAIGALLVAAKSYYGTVEDSIPVQESIGKVPLK